MDDSNNSLRHFIPNWLLLVVVLFFAQFGPVAKADSIRDIWNEVHSEKYKSYRTSMGGNPNDDSPLSMQEWVQFYHQTGGGYNMNMFGVRPADILQVGQFGFYLYFVGFSYAVYVSFGGMGIFQGRVKRGSEIPGVISLIAGAALTHLGGAQIYAMSQMLKQGIPVSINFTIKSAKEKGYSIDYLFAMSRLCGPWGQAPMLAYNDGINQALEERGTIFYSDGLVPTMQIYNELVDHVNARIDALDGTSTIQVPAGGVSQNGNTTKRRSNSWMRPPTLFLASIGTPGQVTATDLAGDDRPGVSGISKFANARMGAHKQQFDGSKADVSQGNPDTPIATYVTNQGIAPVPQGYYGNYANAGAAAAAASSGQDPAWTNILNGEFPRLIRVYGATEFTKSPRAGDYPLARRIWIENGLEAKLIQYFQRLRDGKMTQSHVDALSEEIRSITKRETVAYVDYAFVLQMRRHSYESVRTFVAARYKPDAEGSMLVKFIRVAATLQKKAAEGIETARDGLADGINGTVRWMCEGGTGAGFIIRFADRCIDIALEVSVFLLVFLSPCIMIDSMKGAFVGNINNIITLSVTTGVMLLLMTIWEGVVVSIGLYFFGWDPNSLASSAKVVAGVGGAVTAAVVVPGMAAWAAGGIVVGFWVMKMVGYIFFAFQSRKVASAIMKGEQFVGGLIGRGLTAMGAGALAGVAFAGAGIAATGSAAWGTSFKAGFKSLGKGGPWKAPTGGLSPGGGGGPGGGGMQTGGGGANPAFPAQGGGAAQTTAGDTELGVEALRTPQMTGGGPATGPVSSLFSQPAAKTASANGGRLGRLARTISSAANNPGLKTALDIVRKPLSEISHAVGSGGDPAKYLKTRSAAKAKDAETDEQVAAPSYRDPNAETVSPRPKSIRMARNDEDDSSSSQESMDQLTGGDVQAVDVMGRNRQSSPKGTAAKQS